MVMKREVAMVTRGAGKDAGNCKGGKSNGKGAKRAIARRRAMARPIYKIKKNPSSAPSTSPLQRGCHKGLANNTIAMPLDQANGSTMFMFFFRVGPFLFSWPCFILAQKVCAKLCFCILCLWMGSSTFQEFLGGKGMFLCFYVFENKPVDTL
jgi:hypothetical protein